MADENSSWISRVLTAFANLFSSEAKAQKSKVPVQSSKARHIAGHWPVYIELNKATREAHSPRDDSAFTLRFGASEAGLFRTLRIQTREFNGSYVAEKKSFVVQVPEQLVQEVMRNQDEAVYVEGYLDGTALGSRRFMIPLRF